LAHYVTNLFNISSALLVYMHTQ